MLVGTVGIVPQLIAMLQTRSAGGQSRLGWALCALANLALGFVNGVGHHAIVLAAGNALSVAGGVIAVARVRWYRGCDEAAAAPSTPVHGVVAELHTQEFVVPRAAVPAEHTRRTGEIVLAAWRLTPDPGPSGRPRH